VGIKSVNGSISSAKLIMLPILPTFPPKLLKNSIAETGAQRMSNHSPRPGSKKVAEPSKSIIKQNASVGFIFIVFSDNELCQLIRKRN